MDAQEKEERRAALARELGEEVTLDGLTREWSMVQRKRGHRHSTDDLLTAWYAVTKVAQASRLLDLGSGIGSVGLLTLWRFPAAHLTAIEAQDVSFKLLEANVAMNGLDARVTRIHDDLRNVRADVADGAFDLVTGSPPYFDVKDGVVPADSQKAHARFELRGDVRDYAAAAKRTLAPGGRFVLCFPSVQRERAERACRDAGLPVLTLRDVVPRAGRAPLFSLLHCAHAEDAGGAATVVEPTYFVRDAEGVQTAEHAAARAIFGMGDGAAR
jgi:tRNA1(Val) A37 N6-methylase TrmN6